MPASKRAETIGIDVGGTFTDFVIVSLDGRVAMRKHRSTPRDPSVGVLIGLRAAHADGQIGPGFTLSHGTTVATNALLERRGAPTALITTRGFADVIEIGRQARNQIYALNPEVQAPLLPRERRYEIMERIDWQGEIVVSLNEDDLSQVLDAIASEQIESIAVCFLSAHVNSIHEKRAAAAARKRGFSVSLSSEIAPEPREFERTTTVVANAMVAPILTGYLGRLEEAARFEGAVGLRVMQSNGGALSASDASEHAIKTVLSGPAGGVTAAARIAADADLPRILTFDMGGTSTDVSLIVNGNCPVVTQSVLGGIPLRTPTLDIHTVGAGGGSQAWIDTAGALRVGPQSAGADPGPVAYGAGNVLTVTDANILLGRLPSDVRLAGRIALDRSRVEAKFNELADRLGHSPESAALGIIEVAEAAMTRALRHVSVERGHDPASFTLLSFGGAGGLHCCAMADALGMRHIVVPRFPGALSALGLAIAPIQIELMRALPAIRVRAGLDTAQWAPIFDNIGTLQADAELRKSAETLEGVRFADEILLDLRYEGQSFELRVPFDPGAPELAIAAFHKLHQTRFGYADARNPVEAVMVRYLILGTTDLPPLRFPVADHEGPPSGIARVHNGSDWTDYSRYDRDRLAIGQRLACPSLVLQEDAATFVPAHWTGEIDSNGNLRLARR